MPPGVLYLQATILDDFQSRIVRSQRGLFVSQPQLEPDHLCAHLAGFVNDLRDRLRATEDVDDVGHLRYERWPRISG